MNINFLRINDTGELVEVALGFREFYFGYIEEKGERELKKLFSHSMLTIAAVDWGTFKIDSGKYTVEIQAGKVNIEPI